MNDSVFNLEEKVKSWDWDYYHPIAQCYYDRAIPTMLRLMEVEPGATVLDAGCGPGVHSIRVVRENCRVCAVDVSQTMLQEAETRVEHAGMNHAVEFQKEDLTNLSFEDSSFPYVFSWGVIIHVPDIEKALDELIRVVAPGGKLALYVTNKTAWDHKVESFARFLFRKPLSGQKSLPMGNGVLYDMHGEKLWVWQIDEAALTKYLETRGFLPIHHVVGEFTEIQRRVGGVPRRLLLRLNNLYYRLKLPLVMRLLTYSFLRKFVFEKTG